LAASYASFLFLNLIKINLGFPLGPSPLLTFFPIFFFPLFFFPLFFPLFLLLSFPLSSFRSSSFLEGFPIPVIGIISPSLLVFASSFGFEFAIRGISSSKRDNPSVIYEIFF
jgi:hypothetical protein